MNRFLLLPLMLVAQPLMAAPPIGSAVFAPGTAVPARIVVNDSVWTCAADRCSGPSETRAVTLQRACATLARSVGPVATLTAGAAALAPAALDACNAKNGRSPAALAAK